VWVLIIIWLIWWGLSWIPPRWIKVKKFPFTALTLAPFIFYSAEYIPDWLKKHEERHVLQQRILSPLLFVALYILNYLVNLIWAPFAVIAGLVNRDEKLSSWRKSGLFAQIHAIAYVYIVFELDAIRHGGWNLKSERRMKI